MNQHLPGRRGRAIASRPRTSPATTAFAERRGSLKRRLGHRALTWAGALLLGVAVSPLGAQTEAPVQRAPASAAIAIIIDDLGNLRGEGLRAIELPGSVTFAVLPHTPHARELAGLAHALGKEVMIHLPMEARSGKRMGPGGVSAEAARTEVQAKVKAALASIPEVVGLSNHMGSLLTTLPQPMEWLMEALSEHRPLYFIDSFTDPESVAYQAALSTGVPAARRDVFLDHDRSPAAIERALDKLIRLAGERGPVIGIGHPYAETIGVLKRRLPGLRAQGISLVPASAVVRAREARLTTATR